MKIYIDYNKKIFETALSQITDLCHSVVQNGMIKINITEKNNTVKITNLIEKTKTYSLVRFVIPIELLNVNEVYKNQKGRIIVHYQILIDHKLTAQDLKKIKLLSRLNRTIEIFDSSNLDQSDDFSLYRNFTYINNIEKKDEVKFFYMVCNNKQDTCMYSSCLGNTISLDKEGNYGFCPKYHNKTIFTSIKDGLDKDKLYNSKVFLETLSKSIKFRKNCSNNCIHLNVCQGGCALDESSCNRFKINYEKALNNKELIINKKLILNYELLYIEENILWTVSRGDK